jgi:hypothetical protein
MAILDYLVSWSQREGLVCRSVGKLESGETLRVPSRETLETIVLQLAGRGRQQLPQLSAEFDLITATARQEPR